MVGLYYMYASHICFLTHFSSRLVYLRVSCVPLTPFAGSRASRPSLARRPHCCSILGSCWTRANSTSLSLWSCADPSFSRAANNCWRNGWRRTRYVEEVAGEMGYLHAHPQEPLPLYATVCVRGVGNRVCSSHVFFFFPHKQKECFHIFDKEGVCVKTDFVDCKNDCVCVWLCVCYLRCLL